MEAKIMTRRPRGLFIYMNAEIKNQGRSGLGEGDCGPGATILKE